MKIQILLILLGFMMVTALIEKEDGVLVLTEENFNEAVRKDNKILVEFYAPWCGHCKKLAPEYAAAAKVLGSQNPPVEIAKVDATAHTSLGGKYGVKGYPTLKWFVNGEPTDFSGGRTKDEIVNWINKRSGPPTTAVTLQNLEDTIAKNKVTIVFFGDESHVEFSAFEKAAGLDDKRTYLRNNEKEAADKHGVKAPKIVVFKKFDVPKVEYNGNYDAKNIQAFIEEITVPTLIQFSDDYTETIFQKKQPALFLFRDEQSADQKPLEEEFLKAAIANKGKILFAISGVTNGIQKKVADYVGVAASDIPQIMIVDFAGAAIDKYKFTGDSSKFTTEQITEFITAWKSKKLTKHLKTEEPPAKNDEPVKVVVGKTFNEIVRDSDDDVLLEFYAPWCGHCKSLAPKYNALAAELKNVPGLVIAKMDSTANEVEGVSVSGFPTLKFFAKGSKRSPQDYGGEREIEGFKTWLSTNSKAYKSYLDTQKSVDEKKDDL